MDAVAVVAGAAHDEAFAELVAVREMGGRGRLTDGDGLQVAQVAGWTMTDRDLLLGEPEIRACKEEPEHQSNGTSA